MRLFDKRRSQDSLPASTHRARTIVVDTHPIIHDAFEAAFRRVPDLEFCGSARSSREALQLVDEVCPDVVVLELCLGEEDGMGLLDALHDRHPALKVVVFSVYDEQVYAERALRAGASGYVMKSEPTATMVQAIRHVLHGGLYVNSYILSRIVDPVRPPRSGAPQQTDRSSSGPGTPGRPDAVVHAPGSHPSIHLHVVDTCRTLGDGLNRLLQPLQSARPHLAPVPVTRSGRTRRSMR